MSITNNTSASKSQGDSTMTHASSQPPETTEPWTAREADQATRLQIKMEDNMSKTSVYVGELYGQASQHKYDDWCKQRQGGDNRSTAASMKRLADRMTSNFTESFGYHRSAKMSSSEGTRIFDSMLQESTTNDTDHQGRLKSISKTAYIFDIYATTNRLNNLKGDLATNRSRFESHTRTLASSPTSANTSYRTDAAQTDANSSLALSAPSYSSAASTLMTMTGVGLVVYGLWRMATNEAE